MLMNAMNMNGLVVITIEKNSYSQIFIDGWH